MKRIKSIMFPTTLEERAYMLAWAEEKLHYQFHIHNSFPFSIIRKEKTACIWVYHNHEYPGVVLSVAADHASWCTREVLQTLLGWPFQFLKVERITALVEKCNDRSRRLTEGAGFKREGTIRKGSVRGHDVILYGMLEREYQAKYGQRQKLAKVA